MSPSSHALNKKTSLANKIKFDVYLYVHTDLTDFSFRF